MAYEPTYTELSKLKTYEERFKLLICNGVVGEDTFGFERYLNQTFYRSSEWKRIRREVILRDNGCDLGLADFPISGRIIVHHMVPLTREIILNHDARLVSPEYLICVSHDTHNAITYGDINYVTILQRSMMERTPNDTTLWTPIRQS